MNELFRDSELWEPATRRDPHAFYARVRAAGRPILQIDPAGERMWIVARHADVLDGLSHPAIGHELDRHRAGGRRRPLQTEADRLAARQLISVDPPDHTRLRHLVSRAFTARAVARLEVWIAAVADRLISRVLDRGEFDGVADLADPLPVNVIAELVGVPPADRPQFRAWSAAIVSGSDDHAAATTAFASYIEQLAVRCRSDPQDDLLSKLVALECEGDSLDRDELVAMVQLLLVAGQETTVDLIANAVRLLLTHREQWQALLADLSLAGNVVEETLRFRGSVEIVPPRYTFGPVELGAGTIPPFERVGLSLWGANRDPDVFDSPDTFDIHRTDVAQHIAMGHGIHYCLGASLGRLEARIMLERIADRLQSLRLAVEPSAVDEFRLHHGSLPLQVRQAA